VVTVGFLHTADVHVETFRGLVAELDPRVRDVHFVDPVLLAEADAPGTPERIEARLAEIEAAGADVIVCTCSTIGATAERLGALRVDRPMAEAAVAAGRRIAVLYTVESTLEPTLALLADAGASHVTAVLCPGAWAAWEQGDLEAYREIVAEAARRAAADADVIVLAQASMAPAARLLGDLGIPVLSSPRIAVEHALRTCHDR
jgi:Asp/Glu/hydantoin racemase